MKPKVKTCSDGKLRKYYTDWQIARLKRRKEKEEKLLSLDKQSRETLAETKRQIFERQSELPVPYIHMPYDERMPGLFYTMNITCKNSCQYNCASCICRNKCYNKAVEKLVRRAVAKHKKQVTTHELFHNDIYMDEYNAAAMSTLKEIYLTWGT